MNQDEATFTWNDFSKGVPWFLFVHSFVALTMAIVLPSRSAVTHGAAALLAIEGLFSLALAMAFRKRVRSRFVFYGAWAVFTMLCAIVLRGTQAEPFVTFGGGFFGTGMLLLVGAYGLTMTDGAV